MSESHCSSRLRIGRVPGYPKYRVLSSGSIWYRSGYRRGYRWLRTRAFFDRYGYLQVNLSADGRKRRFYLHTVVLLAFVGPRPNGEECRHMDGEKTNNRVENLCWGTRAENAADQERHDTVLRGSRQSQAKLVESDVLEIRRRANTGKRGIQDQLAEEYGVSDTTISHIVSRRIWRHV